MREDTGECRLEHSIRRETTSIERRHAECARSLDLARLRTAMTRPVIVDLRNIYRADEMKQASFRYASVGRAELK